MNSEAVPKSHVIPGPLKVLLALGVIFTSLLLPLELWPMQGVLLCIVFAAQSLLGIPLAVIVKRLLLFWPFVLLFAISLPLSTGFRSGWDIMGLIIVRSTVSFLTVLCLVHSMTFSDFLRTLRWFRVPEVLVTMLGFMVRYSLILWEEIDRMKWARQARMLGKPSLWRQWRLMAHLIGMLLLRSLDRSQRVHSAMSARGWDGRFRLLDK